MQWSIRYAAESDYERRLRLYRQNYIFKGLKDSQEAKDFYRKQVIPFKPNQTIQPKDDNHFPDAVQCSNCGHLESKEFMSHDDGNWQCAYGMGCSE